MYKKYIYLKAISTIFVTLMINVIFIAQLNAQFFIPIGITDSTITITQPNNPPIGKPYGGGSGYFPIIKPEESNIVISTNDFNFLKTTLANASYGDTIYINDALEIEIPDGETLLLPAGITLASGRGRNGSQGALIFLDKIQSWLDYQIHSIINVKNDVQITGLRIRGPDGSKSLANGNFRTVGILQNNGENLDIHNCEIYDWYFIAVDIRNSSNASIHHNYIHNNQRPGNGYGVRVGWKANANIRYNIFNYNRHSIAANGHLDQDKLPSYTAEYNLILPCAYGHRFDMHGYRDVYQNDPDMLLSCNYWDPCNFAGDRIEMHNNTFVTIPGEAIKYIITIRGISKTGAYITNNVFNTDYRAINQFLFKYYRETCDTCAQCEEPVNAYLNEYGNPYVGNDSLCIYWGDFSVPDNKMEVHSNEYAIDIHIRQINWGGDSEGNVIVAPEIMYFDTGTFEYGDFNNDGRTDVLNQGYVSWSGLTEWELSTEYHYIDPNHIVDFNGDGTEDDLRIIHPTTLWPNGCYP